MANEAEERIWYVTSPDDKYAIDDEIWQQLSNAARSSLSGSKRLKGLVRIETLLN